MQVGLLGPLLVVGRDGRPIKIAGRRLQALLVRLALDPGRRVSGADLVDAVWADDVPGDPVNALQSLVSRLRRALGVGEVIEQDGTGYRLAIIPEAVDTVAFGALVEAARRRLAEGDEPEGLDDLIAAEALWRGEPFAEVGDASYAVGRRAQLGELRLGASLDRLGILIRTGRAGEAVGELEALAEANPLHEPVAGALIRALAAAGRTPEALAHYEAIRTFLGDRLGTDPGPELQALHLQLLRGESAAAEPLSPDPVATTRAPPGRRSNLRAALTSFVGRSDDLTRVLAAVESHRLTTLIGAGGAGKTRLAIEATNRWLAAHDEPAWLIELAPVTDPDDLAGTLLGVLGGRDTRVTERAERLPQDVRERLFDRLRDARCLLVMDNCEHLVDPVAHLVDDILAAAPDVRVLATSRELLGLTGEVLCAIAPLPLPPADVSLADAAGYPAVRLWLDRATAARPDFVLDSATLGPVVEIVRRLDGLPLAIELAAARLRVLPVTEIAGRLSDRFRLLTGGNRTSLPRHRTLRAVVEWSWDLLSPAERLLAERLAVFPAGTDDESAAAVCADRRLAAADIEPLLASLADKSLLQIESAPTAMASEVRYRMLETIREYGIERLAERDELAATRLAHAEHYAAIVVDCEPILRSRDQLTALARLDVDRDNVSAALRYLADSGRGEQALTMMLALAWYWSVLENNTEMATWAELILDVNAGVDLPELAFARAALVMADLTENPDGEGSSWDIMRARLALVSEELAAAPEPRFPGLEILRCMLAGFAGRTDLSDRLVQRATASPDRWLRAAIHASLANLYENAGELDQMRLELELAYEEFVQIGDRWGLSTTLVARAQLATLDGRLDDAIADFVAARGYIREMGSAEEDVYIHIRIADLLIRRGEFDAAREELADLERTGRTVLDSERAMFAMAAVVMIEWNTGRPERALELADQIRADLARRDSSAAMLGHLRGVILAATALISALAGKLEQSTSDLLVAYPSAIETHDQPIVAAVGTAVAGWLTARSRPAEGAVALGAAAAVRGANDWTDRAVAAISEMLRSELGDDGFESGYRRGRNLDRVEAQLRLDPVQYL